LNPTYVLRLTPMMINRHVDNFF